LDGHTSQVTCVAFRLDGRFGASGGLDHMVRLWDLRSGQEAAQFDMGEEVFALAWWGEGRLLVGGQDTVRLLDVPSLRELDRSAPLASAARSLARCDMDGGAHVIVGTEGDGIQVWRLP
jgi:WD40 repeat protein